MWNFSTVIRDVENELKAEEVKVKVDVHTWLTEAERDLHIPAAVAAVKALIAGLPKGTPVVVTMSGHSAADPSADTTHITVNAEISPAANPPGTGALTTEPEPTEAPATAEVPSPPDAPTPPAEVEPAATGLPAPSPVSPPG